MERHDDGSSFSYRNVNSQEEQHPIPLKSAKRAKEGETPAKYVRGEALPLVGCSGEIPSMGTDNGDGGK